MVLCESLWNYFMKLLTQKFQTKNDTAPFSQIKLEDYQSAFEENIAKARAEIDAITNNPEAPTFENTIVALDFSGEALDRLSSIFFNLNSAETNDEIQKIAQEVSPLLTAFGNDISLNDDLFQRVKAIHDQKEKLTLTPEQASLFKNAFTTLALFPDEESFIMAFNLEMRCYE